MGKISLLFLSLTVLVQPQMELAWLRKKHTPTPATPNLSSGLLAPRATDASWCQLPKYNFIGFHYPTLLFLFPTHPLFKISNTSSSLLTLYWLPDILFPQEKKNQY